MSNHQLRPAYGHFRGRLIIELIESNQEYGRYKAYDKCTLMFVDKAGGLWPIEHGLESDGISVPWWLKWLFFLLFAGSPFTGRYTKAVWLHDTLCKQKQIPWQDAHLLMYDAMRADGVGWFRARVIYRALMIGGSKW